MEDVDICLTAIKLSGDEDLTVAQAVGFYQLSLDQYIHEDEMCPAHVAIAISVFEHAYRVRFPLLN